MTSIIPSTSRKRIPIEALQPPPNAKKPKCASNHQDYADKALNPLILANESNSGILEAHLSAIKQVCIEQELCLFIRPTEAASTRLIKHGYASKSLDIHAKSANGGLAKGFIPVDPAFSKQGKKLSLVPQADLMVAHGEANHHRQARITTLLLPTQLLDEIASEASITEIVDDVTATNVRYFTAQDNSPDHVLYQAVREDQNLEAWRISWFPMPADAADIRSMVSKRKPTPLFVYAYKNEVGLDIPVTGDYDLAAIVPSRVAWKLDGTHTADEDAHGASIISPYGQFLVKELNARCNQTVFRHGAETQNLHFAQPLDAELICITSGGGAYVVQKEKMAEASFDMVCRQYMPKWNPVYARDDLPLGGKLFGLIPQHLKENFSAHYQGLAGLVGRLRSLHREHFSHELPFEARSQQEMHARESKNFHEVHYQLVSDLKKALHACLQSVEIDNNEEMNVSKASDLCDQITDIIFYSERYNAYINFAEKSNASPDFLFFNEGCFKSTSISGAFMMQTPARKAWADTARNISENIGNPKFLPISPDAIKTNRSLRKSLNTERKRLLNTLNMSRQSLSF